jgi:hypothetical protein
MQHYYTFIPIYMSTQVKKERHELALRKFSCIWRILFWEM